MAAILLVEDDDVLRRLIHRMLERAGHEVHDAGNGSEALRLFAQVHIDLVITDLVMPDKDGLGTIVELKKLNPMVRIIAMSGGWGGDTELYLRIASHLGVMRALAKPFLEADLLQAVQAVLAERVN
jgi:CheY-like chemotaxis protein